LAQGVDSFPQAASKKGLQVEIVEDALELGVKHATLNFNLCALVDPKGDPKNLPWQSDGRTFHFRRDYFEATDRQVRRLADNRVLVYLILLTYQSGDAEVNRLMLHPRYDPKAPNRLGAFNSATDDGRRWLTATLEFVAERWSKPGRVVGYILGNEVNSHWFWSNMGRSTLEEFADEYERVLRLAVKAVHRQCPWARVYISLEHHWNIRYPPADDRQAFPGRALFDLLAKRAKDVDWHLAHHPYPENLFEPRFWNDKSATPDADAARITFKNLQVLADYMRRPEARFEGRPRRIILSEQGFHTPRGPDGETIQAAAYCCAYKKVEATDGIDAFVLHRHVDHDGEGGLLLGLRRNRPRGEELRPKKLIYDCFRLADTPEWDKAFAFALPILGLKSWSEMR
jgi:hypothetical protein